MADKEEFIAEGYPGFKAPPPPEPPGPYKSVEPQSFAPKEGEEPGKFTTAQIELVKNSGAGFLADLVKASGAAFGLDQQTGADAGAGFVSDVLKSAAPPPGPPDPLPGEEPTLNSINPNTGPSDTVVSVNGSNFTDTSVVYFGGNPVATIFVANSQLRFTIGGEAGGAYTVWVQQGSFQTVQQKTFTVTAAVAATEEPVV